MKLLIRGFGFRIACGITHKRMGHKNPTTTEDDYIDKDTSQALVDLYEKYAKELLGCRYEKALSCLSLGL